MMLRSFFAVGALALSASAFLIVPEVDAVDKLDGRRSNVELKCSGCPFPVIREDNLAAWKDGVDSVLNIDLVAEGDRLFLNEVEILPMPQQPVHITGTLQRQSDGQKSPPLPLGYALERLPQTARIGKDGLQLMSLYFTIIDIAGYPVPMDGVRIDVVKSRTGDLFVAKTKTDANPIKNLSWRKCRSKPKCLKALLIARIREVLIAAKARALGVANKFSFKGCHGKSGFRLGKVPHQDTSSASKAHHWSHGHGGHRHHRGGFWHSFSRAMHVIVIPAVLGLSAGITACVIGMLIGQGIAALWVRFRRGGNTRHTTCLEAGEDVEKEPLVYEGAEDDLPPQYDEEEHGKIMLPVEKE
ncbi:hypothetical protein AJ80_08030 [Polytolypa hystricis UAMH7299]|uniref:DUF7728 domain-containing protein n=1 Tax=Polytolypa hystricis (strain UAMH7299) TaxID=1447883 RepID=A0A2B7X6G0_POLH7|nr:hypothetical protein AJ80_08030 [Polytolypa hystricis UAMH7299]